MNNAGLIPLRGSGNKINQQKLAIIKFNITFASEY